MPAQLALLMASWLCMALLPGSMLVAQDAQTALRNLEDEDLDALVAELRPVVEKVCGRKFQQPPIAVLADAGDMMRVFRIELEPQIAALYQGQPARRIQRALQLRADTVGLSAIGKLELASGEVLVVPERVTANVRALGLQDVDELAVLKLFVAHELVHALQQQEIALGKRYAAMTAADEIDSLVMRTEGHAVMCSEMVMRELGLLAAIPTARAIVAGSERPLQELGATISLRQGRARSALLYLTGADILYDVHKQSGMAGVWRLLASRGAIGELLRPQAKLPVIVNLQACFLGVGERLGGATWCSGSGALSEVLLLSENYTGRKQTLELLARCRGAAHWQGNSGTPFAWRSATVLRFLTEQAATSYRELCERCAGTDLSLATKTNANSAAGPEFEGGVCRWLHHEQDQLLWFQRGEHLLQVTLVKAPLAHEQLAAIADEVFRALAL